MCVLEVPEVFFHECQSKRKQLEVTWILEESLQEWLLKNDSSGLFQENVNVVDTACRLPPPIHLQSTLYAKNRDDKCTS